MDTKILLRNTTAFNPIAAREAFICKAQCYGIYLPSIIADGTIHEIKCGDAKVWYTYHEEFDHSWGCFGDYKSMSVHDGVKWSSRTKSTTRLSPADTEALRSTVVTEDDRRDWRRKQARHDWLYGKEASDDHPYLRKKQIEPHGVRVFRGHRIIADVEVNGAIMVPVFDDDEALQAIQFITRKGEKRNQGPLKDGHFWIDRPMRWRTLCVAEGFATAASVSEEWGYPCCVSFGVSGMEHAAQYIKEKFRPTKPIIIIADADDGGVGVKVANAAARAVDGLVFVADEGTDFNDMVRVPA
jgi:putative DNA primase/helicase